MKMQIDDDNIYYVRIERHDHAVRGSLKSMWMR